MASNTTSVIVAFIRYNGRIRMTKNLNFYRINFLLVPQWQGNGELQSKKIFAKFIETQFPDFYAGMIFESADFLVADNEIFICFIFKCRQIQSPVFTRIFEAGQKAEIIQCTADILGIMLDNFEATRCKNFLQSLGMIIKEMVFQQIEFEAAPVGRFEKMAVLKTVRG